MREQLRDASQPPVKTWYINPSGRIVTVLIGAGICNGITDHTGQLLPERREEGYVSLADAYADDDLGPEGFGIFRDAQSARAMGAANTKLPDAYLPKLVHERRDEAVNSRTFKLPPLPGKPVPAKKVKAARVAD